MSNSARDENRVTTLIGVSTTDLTTPTKVAVDPITNGLVVSGAVSISTISDDHKTNTIDEASATVTYIGKENASAVWSILKIDTTSGTVFTYATIVNNAAQTSGYATAWAARASLTYSQYSVAF